MQAAPNGLRGLCLFIHSYALVSTMVKEEETRNMGGTLRRGLGRGKKEGSGGGA